MRDVNPSAYSTPVEATLWRNGSDGVPQIKIDTDDGPIMVRIPKGVARERATAYLNGSQKMDWT